MTLCVSYTFCGLPRLCVWWRCADVSELKVFFCDLILISTNHDLLCDMYVLWLTQAMCLVEMC